MSDQLTLDLQAPVARRRQRVHKHSADAYHQALPGLNSRALLILAWLRQHGPATDRQVMRGMGYSDPNAVRPRITELIDAKRAEECGQVRDQETGKTVRVVRFREQGK